MVHTDDTGWRVDGEGAFLMAFETEDATVYQVRGRHRNEEVREVVPSGFAQKATFCPNRRNLPEKSLLARKVSRKLLGV